MSITNKSRIDCFNSMKSYLQTLTTNLSDFNTGSVLLSLFDTVAAELEQLYNAQVQIQDAAFISTATGSDLDKKVADFTLERRGASFSSGIVTFGRTTSSTQNFIIPAGTQISTQATSTAPSVSFETIEEAILSAGSLTVNVQARAVSSGISGNVSASTITILPSPPTGIEFVINYNAFTGGADSETDEELRNRLSLYLNSLARGTKLALESAGLSVTGITSVSVLENDPSPGYVKMYVADSTGTASDATLEEVRSVVENYRPVSVIVFVYAPSVQYVDISCYLSIDPTFESTSVITNVTSAITNYISGLKLNENVIRANIIESIIAVDGVTNVDTTVQEKEINEGLLVTKNAFLTPVISESQTSTDKSTVGIEYAAQSASGVYLSYDITKTRNFLIAWNNKIIGTSGLPIYNEQQTTPENNVVLTNYDLATVGAFNIVSGPADDGIWDNPSHAGTNYAVGATYTGNRIQTAISLPQGTTVYIQYQEESGANTQTAVIVDYNKQQLYTSFNISDVEGVWLSSDLTHTGTNYFIDGLFENPPDVAVPVITVGTALPAPTSEVIVSYWQELGGTGLKPYDNVAIQNGRIARPRSITVSLLT